MLVVLWLEVNLWVSGISGGISSPAALNALSKRSTIGERDGLGRFLMKQNLFHCQRNQLAQQDNHYRNIRTNSIYAYGTLRERQFCYLVKLLTDVLRLDAVGKILPTIDTPHRL